MSRGKRYDNEPKLNIKKVIAVILFIAVITVFVIAVKKMLSSDNTTKITAKTYFTICTEDKWGVIDNNGNIVINPTYDEMIIIPDNEKDIFICTENVDYEKDTYTTKVINSKNKEIFKQYNKVQVIENFDEYNNLWYEENVLKYEENGKFGLINLDGKVILQSDYDEIYALKGIKNSIITVKNSKMGVVDNKGVSEVPNEYDEIQSLGKDTNLYIVKDGANYGIYKKTNIKYQEVKSLNNKDIYCVKENNKYKIIDSEEKEVANIKFDDVKQIKDNVVVYKKDKKYGAYNIESKISIKNNYDDMIYTTNNNFIVKSKDSYGIIDINGTENVKKQYSSIGYYDEAQVYELEPKNNTSGENIILNKDLQEIAKGIVNEVNSKKSYIKIWTQEDYKYFNLLGEEKLSSEILKSNTIFLKKQNGKYGYVDKDGNVVIDYIYDDAKEQNAYGYAAVKQDGKWGAIDSKGNIVCEIDKNLDEYLVIDFIGKYHLGRDINLNYYTEE